MKLKPLDFVVIIVLVIITIGSSGFAIYNSQKNYKTKYVEIEVKGKLYKKLPLDNTQKQQIKVVTDLGENTIEIVNSKVRIIDADCKDKICIKDGAISKPGSVLVCLPHKVVVQIKGENTESDTLSF
jgi:hypothetical protein